MIFLFICFLESNKSWEKLYKFFFIMWQCGSFNLVPQLSFLGHFFLHTPKWRIFGDALFVSFKYCLFEQKTITQWNEQPFYFYSALVYQFFSLSVMDISFHWDVWFSNKAPEEILTETRTVICVVIRQFGLVQQFGKVQQSQILRQKSYWILPFLHASFWQFALYRAHYSVQSELR